MIYTQFTLSTVHASLLAASNYPTFTDNISQFMDELHSGPHAFSTPPSLLDLCSHTNFSQTTRFLQSIESLTERRGQNIHSDSQLLQFFHQHITEGLAPIEVPLLIRSAAVMIATDRQVMVADEELSDSDCVIALALLGYMLAVRAFVVSNLSDPEFRTREYNKIAADFFRHRYTEQASAAFLEALLASRKVTNPLKAEEIRNETIETLSWTASNPLQDWHFNGNELYFNLIQSALRLENDYDQFLVLSSLAKSIDTTGQDVRSKAILRMIAQLSVHRVL